MNVPTIVDFPLRGDWITPNTPGTKIPSHGTDLFGERYAFDFVGVDPRSRRMQFYKSNPLQYLILGVRLQDCFGWGQPIYSVAAGVVVQSEDGCLERDPVHIVRDFSINLKNTRTIKSKQKIDFRVLAGNFIIIETNFNGKESVSLVVSVWILFNIINNPFILFILAIH